MRPVARQAVHHEGLLSYPGSAEASPVLILQTLYFLKHNCRLILHNPKLTDSVSLMYHRIPGGIYRHPPHILISTVTSVNNAQTVRLKDMNEGVSAPNASYTVSGSAGNAGTSAGGNVAAATVEEAEESYYESILEQLFSYEDYLRFIDLYTKILEAQQKEEEQERQQQEEQSDSYRAYQDLKFSPSAISLLGGRI